jgi:Na+-translocating ferredoxin:NAD+ oxidoreductase subunit B
MMKPSTEHNKLTLVEQLDQILPQTQCQRCGYAACRPYAAAMASGEASPNRCPPGGQAGVLALSKILDQDALELDPSRGVAGVGFIVKIDPAYCIGCTKCIRTCPVDAIIGANKRMHTVIADLCTGCELCIPPCPTDCITLEARAQAHWSPQDAFAAQNRYLGRLKRLAQDGFDLPLDDSDNDAQAPSSKAFGQIEPKQQSAENTQEKARPESLERALEKALQQARERLGRRSQPLPQELPAEKNPHEST